MPGGRHEVVGRNKMSELKLFSTKIDSWGSPITISAFNKIDAEGLTRALFKVPTNVGVTATEKKTEPESEEERRQK